MKTDRNTLSDYCRGFLQVQDVSLNDLTVPNFADSQLCDFLTPNWITLPSERAEYYEKFRNVIFSVPVLLLIKLLKEELRETQNSRIHHHLNQVPQGEVSLFLNSVTSHE